MSKQNDRTPPEDLSTERFVEFSWMGNSVVKIKEEMTNSLNQPKTAVVRIPMEFPRKRALRALHDFNWYVLESWPEEFHIWADIVKFEKEQKEIARESHARGEFILSRFIRILSEEDLRCFNEAVRSYVHNSEEIDHYWRQSLER